MPRQIHILFNLLALFVIMYIVVDTFYSIVGMQLYKAAGPQVVMLEDIATDAAEPSTAPAYDAIVARNIFGSTEEAEVAPVEEKKVDEEMLENLEETSLQLSLLGTVAGDSASARAIILDEKERKQDIYRIGDSVQGAEIRQILRGKIVLRHGEKDEILTMAEATENPPVAAQQNTKYRRINRAMRARAARSSEDEAEIEPPEEPGLDNGEVEEEVISVGRDELQNSINNLNDLMTQVRIRPYFRGGKSEGLIVSQIQGDSIFAKMGLMNGDIIASVNGQPMNSPEEAFQLYNSLNSASQVSIEITRRGQKKMLTYDIR